MVTHKLTSVLAELQHLQIKDSGGMSNRVLIHTAVDCSLCGSDLDATENLSNADVKANKTFYAVFDGVGASKLSIIAQSSRLLPYRVSSGT